MDLCRSNTFWAQFCKHIKITGYIYTIDLSVVTYVMSQMIFKSLAFANLNLGMEMTLKIRSISL